MESEELRSSQGLCGSSSEVLVHLHEDKNCLLSTFKVQAQFGFFKSYASLLANLREKQQTT